MTNQGEKSRDWLAKNMKRTFGRTVHYQRGDSTNTATARLARIDTTIDESSGMQVRVCDQAFLIDAADLEINGVPIIPTPGDRIIDGNVDDGTIYEVAAAGGADCWRWSDAYQKTYYINTRKIGTAPLAE